ncbi:MAG TPA: hypothetical protein VGN34_03690 [Ktedonobacteraceae bacterium]|jgi:exonuclease VII small subunit
MSSEESPNEVRVELYDTPTQRASINQLSTDHLDAWLEQIRERRLTQVRKLEHIAKLKSDEVRLEAFLRFEKAAEQARKALVKLEEQEVKVEKLIHKCRILAMTAQLEVGMEDADAT